MRKNSDQIKKVSLELGGNAPSSSSTTPKSTLRLTARFRRISATPARLVFQRTAFTSNRAFTRVRRKIREESAALVAMASLRDLRPHRLFLCYLKCVWRVVEALEYGMVGSNTGRISSEAAPLGGLSSQASMYGRHPKLRHARFTDG